jgi:hypothetical protein
MDALQYGYRDMFSPAASNRDASQTLVYTALPAPPSSCEEVARGMTRVVARRRRNRWCVEEDAIVGAS